MQTFRDFCVLCSDAKCTGLGPSEREHVEIIFTSVLGINVSARRARQQEGRIGWRGAMASQEQTGGNVRGRGRCKRKEGETSDGEERSDKEKTSDGKEARPTNRGRGIGVINWDGELIQMVQYYCNIAVIPSTLTLPTVNQSTQGIPPQVSLASHGLRRRRF
jgi:hypothetical protein